MTALLQPRNAAAIERAVTRQSLRIDDAIVVSFVGTTSLTEPHVYVDPGRRYDWRFIAGLCVLIVTRPGINASAVIGDLFAAAMPYPTLIDVERKVVASIVDSAGKLKLWPYRRGGESWQTLFG